MTIKYKHLAGNYLAHARILCAVAIVPALGACVAEVRVPPPPPPPRAAIVVETPAPAVEVTAQVAPPPLPVYEQPELPGPGYVWTPGYWHYGAAGYFWVPGTWIMPPRVGVLWTPGYWGYAGGVYVFHGGYWGPHIGFYGGVNYGGGYVGTGWAGGRWVNGGIAYNTSVTNVNTTIVHNTYNETVINNTTVVNRVSYNGGPAGVHAVATAQETVAMHEPHVPPTSVQTQHFQAASQNHALLASVNQGHPAVAATPHAGNFSGPGVVAAHQAAPMPGANHPQTAVKTAYQPPPANAAKPANGAQPKPVKPKHPPKEGEEKKPYQEEK